VSNQWKTRVHGTKMFILSQKLKQTKLHIKYWARNFVGNNQQKLLTNMQKIDEIDEKLLSQPDSARLNNWLQRMLRQREKLLLFNQKYWGNTKRKEWLVNGDRNSLFFSSKLTLEERGS